jgi:hypothetical protein
MLTNKFENIILPPFETSKMLEEDKMYSSTKRMMVFIVLKRSLKLNVKGNYVICIFKAKHAQQKHVVRGMM